jgi:hypothetical protein
LSPRPDRAKKRRDLPGRAFAISYPSERHRPKANAHPE